MKKGARKINAIITVRVICFFLALLICIGQVEANTPENGSYRSVRIMMERITDDEPYDVVFVGASLFNFGLDENILEEKSGKSCLKLTIPATNHVVQYYVLKYLLDNYSPELVVLNVSMYQLVLDRANTNYASNTISLIPFTAGKFEAMWAACPPERYVNALLPKIAAFTFAAYFGFDTQAQENEESVIENTSLEVARTEETPSLDANGPANQQRARDEAKAALGEYVPQYIGNIRSMGSWLGYRNFTPVDISIQYLQKSVDICKEKGVKVILVSTVIPYFTIEQEIDKYKNYMRIVRDIAQTSGVDCVLFELAKESYYTRMDSDFKDFKHMSKAGGEAYSEVLGRLIRDYQNENILPDDMFYPDIGTMMQDVDRIFSVFADYNPKKQMISIASFQGYSVIPEYSVLYCQNGTNEWQQFSQYSTEIAIDVSSIAPRPGDSFRIEARIQSGTGEVQQYYLLSISE